MFRILLLMLMFTVQATSILMPELWPFSAIRHSVRGSLCTAKPQTATNVFSIDKIKEVARSIVAEQQAVAKQPQTQPTVVAKPQTTTKPQPVTTPVPQTIQQPVQ